MPLYTAISPDGERATCIALPIEPYDEAIILFGNDTTAQTKDMLLELESHWPTLWPEMLRLLKEGMTALNIEVDLATREFHGGVSRMEPGYFMSDRSDIHIEIDYGDAWPEWHYFLRGGQVVHFQHVY